VVAVVPVVVVPDVLAEVDDVVLVADVDEAVVLRPPDPPGAGAGVRSLQP
jgi:hypothetical protein